MKINVLALLLTFSTGELYCHADNCNRVRTVYSTYQAPVYKAPINYNYENYTLIPKVIAVETHRVHYYSIDNAYQQSLLADAIVGRLLQIQFKNQNGNTQTNTPVNRNPGPSVSSIVPSNTVPGNILLGISSYQNQDLSVALKTSCLKCHDGATRQALLSSDDKLLDLPRSYTLEVYRQVNTGRMPKSASPLEDKFLPLIDQWVNASK